MSFLFIGGVIKRFITYLDDLAKRTYFGTDGTEPQRSGVLGYLIDGLEGLLGFFGLVTKFNIELWGRRYAYRNRAGNG